MAVSITKPALNLREQLAKLTGLNPAPERHTFFFAGDGSQTAFPLPEGWRPRDVFSDGLLRRPGAGEDYEVAFDGFTHIVTFAVAPGSAVDVGIMAEREV